MKSLRSRINKESRVLIVLDSNYDSRREEFFELPNLLGVMEVSFCFGYKNFQKHWLETGRCEGLSLVICNLSRPNDKGGIKMVVDPLKEQLKEIPIVIISYCVGTSWIGDSVESGKVYSALEALEMQDYLEKLRGRKISKDFYGWLEKARNALIK